MTPTTQIFAFVTIALVGYIIDGVVLFPVIRVAARKSSIAATGWRALAILCAWLVGFLLALVISHLAGWHPRHAYVLLSLILVIHAWGLLIWYWRWERRIDRKDWDE